MNDRTTMGGKPVYSVPSKTIINFKSGFGKKLLCDDLTFTTGTACAYSCSFCYVPSAMKKQTEWLQEHGVKGEHEDIVIRRAGALDILRSQLTDRNGKAKFLTPDDHRVIYASPLVDVAANMTLVNETIEACKVILSLTNWQIRLLSKSNLLPKIAEGLECVHWAKDRVIYGVSTGTLDDGIAKVFEQGTPLVSKRIQSLHWLQDNGFRTFGMICPSLPVVNYPAFAQDAFNQIRGERCESVWAEVLNVRGESMTKTVEALLKGGFAVTAERVQEVSENKGKWEQYARATFEAHAPLYRPGQLRFLQYTTKVTEVWWTERVSKGVVLL